MLGGSSSGSLLLGGLGGLEELPIGLLAIEGTMVTMMRDDDSEEEDVVGAGGTGEGGTKEE